MAWYEDLSSCEYFGPDFADQLKAVGWLEVGHPYSQGNVDLEFVAKLTQLLTNPWQPFFLMGPHFCSLCRLTGGPASFKYGGMTAQLGVSNLFVPSDGFLYVSPSTILHYIDSHSYAPPQQFQDAVLSCPTMRSIEYLRAILTNGPKGFATGKTDSEEI